MMTPYDANELLLSYAEVFCCYFIGLNIPLLKMTLGRITNLNLKLKFKNFSNTMPHIPMST